MKNSTLQAVTTVIEGFNVIYVGAHPGKSAPLHSHETAEFFHRIIWTVWGSLLVQAKQE